jgi:hypothetical protein
MVSLTAPAALYSEKDSWYSFLLSVKVWLEGLGQLKNAMTSSEIKTANIRPVSSKMPRPIMLTFTPKRI